MTIGDLVWIFDSNHREYRCNAAGQSYGGPIHRGHFRQVAIASETRLSWVLADGRKVNKKSLEGIYTEAQIDDDCYIAEQRHLIAQKIYQCKSADKLRKIDALLAA